MENKEEELTKAKNEQIEKLIKIKDILRKKLDEAKDEISNLKVEFSNLKKDYSDLQEENSDLKNNNISSIDQNTTTVDSRNDQIMEFLKGNRNKMDFVLKKLENLISFEVKKSEHNEIPKPMTVKKDTFVKENSSEIETKIIGEKPVRKGKVEKQQPSKPIKRKPSPSKKLLSIPYPPDGTIRCPNCNKIKWQEIKNKSKMISLGVYAKKYYCKTCRTEWEFTY